MAQLQAPDAAAPPEAMLPLAYRVASKRAETHDTWTLALEPEGDAIDPPAPGQFTMLYAFGTGEAPISVSASPLVHTVRAVGAVTRAICALPEGGSIGVRGPYGMAWPMHLAEGRDVVVVSGGIALAPVRLAIYELLRNRERYGRVSILYGGRSPHELLYVDEHERWRSVPDVEVGVSVDTAPPGWRGRVGLVTTLIPRAAFDPRDCVALVCGPEVMMRFAVGALRERGVPPEAIWLSYERSMKCAVGHCGHCQLGPLFVCKDGPVLRHDRVEPFARVREL